MLCRKRRLIHRNVLYIHCTISDQVWWLSFMNVCQRWDEGIQALSATAYYAKKGCSLAYSNGRKWQDYAGKRCSLHGQSNGVTTLLKKSSAWSGIMVTVSLTCRLNTTYSEKNSPIYSHRWLDKSIVTVLLGVLVCYTRLVWYELHVVSA